MGPFRCVIKTSQGERNECQERGEGEGRMAKEGNEFPCFGVKKANGNDDGDEGSRMRRGKRKDWTGGKRNQMRRRWREER